MEAEYISRPCRWLQILSRRDDREPREPWLERGMHPALKPGISTMRALEHGKAAHSLGPLILGTGGRARVLDPRHQGGLASELGDRQPPGRQLGRLWFG